MLDLVKLKTFQMVATTRNFTRAAAELGYSQSSITIHVQHLERELGARLLNRATRKIVLTDAGKKALEYAERLLALADEAAQAISKKMDVSGLLSVSIPTALAACPVVDVMREFQELYPAVSLDLVWHPDSGSQVDAVLEEQADMAFLVGSPSRSGKLTSAFLGAEEILIVATPEYGAPDSGQLTLAALPEKQLLVTEKSCPFRQTFERALTGAKVPLRKILTLGSIEAVKRSALAGIGLGVVPKSAVAAELEDRALVALPWHPGGVHANIQMLRRRTSAAPPLQAMWDFLEATFVAGRSLCRRRPAECV